MRRRTTVYGSHENRSKHTYMIYMPYILAKFIPVVFRSRSFIPPHLWLATSPGDRQVAVDTAREMLKPLD